MRITSVIKEDSYGNRRYSQDPRRLKIYYLLSKCPRLTPTSGDRISEINIIKAISVFADVYYNGTLYEGGKIVEGHSEVLTPHNNYDLYYIRANPSVARKVPSDRLVYFSTPFNLDIFKNSLALTTYTDSWTNDMKGDFSLTRSIYPREYQGFIQKKNIFTINQVIDPIFYRKKDSLIKEFREREDAEFLLGLFGRVAKSCFPHLILQSIPEIRKVIPNFKVLVGTSDKHALKIKEDKRYSEAAKNLIFRSFVYENMPSAIASCDATFYPYIDHQGEFAGSMKVLESMAVGTPIIAPEYLARKEELGDGYPLFLRTICRKDFSKSGGYSYSEAVVSEFIEKILMLKDESFKRKISKNLVDKSLDYSIKSSSIKLDKTFTKIYDLRGKSNV